VVSQGGDHTLARVVKSLEREIFEHCAALLADALVKADFSGSMRLRIPAVLTASELDHLPDEGFHEVIIQEDVWVFAHRLQHPVVLGERSRRGILTRFLEVLALKVASCNHILSFWDWVESKSDGGRRAGNGFVDH